MDAAHHSTLFEGLEMSNAFYDMYKRSRDLLDRYEREKEDDDPEELGDIVKDWIDVIQAIDKSHPQVREWYESNKAIQYTFTNEQKDFICWQIGDWYLMMKPLLEGQHNLGYMKEKLKEMICGD